MILRYLFAFCFINWISEIILLHEKFLQFDWLKAVVFQLINFEIPTCENYKPFAGFWFDFCINK